MSLNQDILTNLRRMLILYLFTDLRIFLLVRSNRGRVTTRVRRKYKRRWGGACELLNVTIKINFKLAWKLNKST